jgi:EF hand
MKKQVLAVLGMAVLGTLGLATGARADDRGQSGVPQRVDANRDEQDAGAQPPDTEQQSERGGRHAHARKAHLMQRFDTNGNGVLDPDEKAAVKQARAEMVRRFDTNGDGRLDRTERRTARAARRNPPSEPSQPPQQQ